MNKSPLRLKGKVIQKKRRTNFEPRENTARIGRSEELEERYGHQREHLVFSKDNQGPYPDEQEPEENENPAAQGTQDEGDGIDIAENIEHDDEDNTNKEDLVGEEEQEEELDPSMFMTEAEYKFELARQRREKELLAKQAKTTFRDQIHKFNAKLAKEPAHFDVPKISHTK
mmetsp:Transcript_17005/g.29737  ORF Transcript_17005/g.29737 Transcript_17005/m.29737 type:complete len:171 (-) Transcript_17005:81-593(-)